jgi:hypothetical protein
MFEHYSQAGGMTVEALAGELSVGPGDGLTSKS